MYGDSAFDLKQYDKLSIDGLAGLTRKPRDKFFLRFLTLALLPRASYCFPWNGGGTTNLAPALGGWR
jgi:hypothetical protein